MSAPARIIFAGSPEFAVPALKELIAGPHKVVAVLTQPDRPAGRGRELKPSPVKKAALQAEVPVLQPETLRDAAIQEKLRTLRPDLMIVIAYGLLLPREVLDIPVHGCINVHASLLPRWRGASPIQAAILAGDEQTGISLMQMDEGLDTGPVYSKSVMTIEADETAGELHDRLAERGAKMVDVYLEDLLNGVLQSARQPDTGATYAPKIDKADGLIDWSEPAAVIDRKIRAYNPWPMAYTLYQGESLRCLECAPADSNGSGPEPGTMLGLEADGLHVQTGDGVLVLSRVQMPGRRPVTAIDFANAYPTKGLVLGR